MSGMYGWMDKGHTDSRLFVEQLHVLLFCHCLLSYASPSGVPYLTKHLVNAPVIDLLHIHIQCSHNVPE